MKQLAYLIVFLLQTQAQAQVYFDGQITTKKEYFSITSLLTFKDEASLIRSSTQTDKPVDETDNHWNCETNFEFDFAEVQTTLKDRIKHTVVSDLARNMVAIRTVSSEVSSPEDCQAAKLDESDWIPFAVNQPRFASASIALERTPSPGYTQVNLRLFESPVTVWAKVKSGTVVELDISELTQSQMFTYQVTEEAAGSVSTLEQNQFFLKYRP